jgi:hypothetical protein
MSDLQSYCRIDKFGSGQVTRAVRVYQLNLYGPAHGKAVRKSIGQYVLVAADDDAAFQTALALHAKAISQAAFVELTNDEGSQISWAGGGAQGVLGPEARPLASARVQQGASKASHWAQTRSFMFRIVRVASISGR